MKHTALWRVSVVAVSAAGVITSLCSGAAAADEPTVAAPSTIEAVTVFPQGARLSRRAHATVPAGSSRVVVVDLPPAAAEGTVRARVEGALLVSVEERRETHPEPTATARALELDAQIRALEDLIAAVNDQVAAAALELKVVEAISIRAAANATNDGGTEKLDLATLDKQLEWLGAERVRLGGAAIRLRRQLEELSHELSAAQANRAQLGGSQVVVVVEVVVESARGGEATVHLDYQVGAARWTPRYSLRGDVTEPTATLEFDARLSQSTGEDWPAVPLTLSTAAAAGRMEPPPVRPAFVDVYAPPPPSAPAATAEYRAHGKSADFEGDSAGEPADQAGFLVEKAREDKDSYMGRRAVSAQVSDAGPALVYSIPTGVAVPSNAEHQSTTRIADVPLKASYLRQAQPLVDTDVYLRGTFVNDGPYQLLAGRVDLFMNKEFVGQSGFGKVVAPAAEFKVFLGPDRAVTATREIVARTDSQTGLFGGGRDVHFDYRIRIANGSAAAVEVEVFDRRVVSRSDRIEVKATAINPALATDKEYAENQMPQGILKWLLSVPPTPAGELGTAVTWTVDVSHSKDIRTTTLPE